METMKTKEENRKKSKRKLMLIALVCSLIFIVLLILAVIIFGKARTQTNYTSPNSYSFLGNILATTSIYNDILLVIEEKDNSINAVTLKNNELVSQKMLCSNLDYNEITDYTVVLEDYDSNKNKDFLYISEKVENGYAYKFYTIDRNGDIKDLGLESIVLDTKKASVKVIKNGNKYEYNAPIFFYDGYKVLAEIGEHKLTEKSAVKNTISKNSKVTIDGRYKAIPRKYSVSNDIPEYVQNVNNYLLDIAKKQLIEVDLDGEGQKEYIICFSKNGKTYVSLFDNSANFIANLLEVNGEKMINEILEVADIDNDNIMELICVKEESIEVHKYNSGFYY